MQDKTQIKKIGLIVGIIFFVGILGVLILSSGKKVVDETTKTPPTENHDPVGIVIDNTDKLRSLLLSDQYTSVMDQVIGYVESSVDAKAEHAYIVGEPKLERNGNVSFVVHVDGSNKEFDVLVDRTEFGFITVSIPGSGYKKRTKVY